MYRAAVQKERRRLRKVGMTVLRNSPTIRERNEPLKAWSTYLARSPKKDTSFCRALGILTNLFSISVGQVFPNLDKAVEDDQSHNGIAYFTGHVLVLFPDNKKGQRRNRQKYARGNLDDAENTVPDLCRTLFRLVDLIDEFIDLGKAGSMTSYDKK